MFSEEFSKDDSIIQLTAQRSMLKLNAQVAQVLTWLTSELDQWENRIKSPSWIIEGFEDESDNDHSDFLPDHDIAKEDNVEVILVAVEIEEPATAEANSARARPRNTYKALWNCFLFFTHCTLTCVIAWHIRWHDKNDIYKKP